MSVGQVDQTSLLYSTVTAVLRYYSLSLSWCVLLCSGCYHNSARRVSDTCQNGTGTVVCTRAIVNMTLGCNPPPLQWVATSIRCVRKINTFRFWPEAVQIHRSLQGRIKVSMANGNSKMPSNDSDYSSEKAHLPCPSSAPLQQELVDVAKKHTLSTFHDLDAPSELEHWTDAFIRTPQNCKMNLMILRCEMKRLKA